MGARRSQRSPKALLAKAFRGRVLHLAFLPALGYTAAQTLETAW